MSEKKASQPRPADGTGTANGSDTGVSGVTRESAAPGMTGGYGSDVRPGNAEIEDESEATSSENAERRK